MDTDIFTRYRILDILNDNLIRSNAFIAREEMYYDNIQVIKLMI